MFLFWIPIAILVLAITGFLLSRRVTESIPVLINGLIPSEPGAADEQDKGTMVLIWYADQDPTDESSHVFKGLADEGGKVLASIPSGKVGSKLGVRARLSLLKPVELVLTVPDHGIVYTVKNEEDGDVEGKLRGRDVGNLNDYYREAIASADNYRAKYVREAAIVSSRPLARIPVWFWLISYLVVIVTFAADYWRYPEAFDQCLTSYWHSLYFSSVTITTLGYGEVVPLEDLMRFAISLQAVGGIFLVGFALNSLFSGVRDR